jgi:protein-S-isoprenylcysteine O-methyltransferase Ste14
MAEERDEEIERTWTRFVAAYRGSRAPEALRERVLAAIEAESEAVSPGPTPAAGGTGRAPWRRRLVPGAAVVFYLLIALEAAIMITPFTVYFYAVYAPILGRLEASPWTAWLTAFFLPHISYPGAPLLTVVAWLGPVLLTLGLGIFLVCAAQVYSAKLLRRGVVKGGLYRLVRHPQYLGLGIAGLGLLLYWPRFIILLLYLSMLFVYYLLARHEESRMEARFGEGYRRFLAATPMFLPRGLGERAVARLVGPAPRGRALAALWVAVLVAGTGLGFATRAYSVSLVPRIQYSETLAAISLAPADGNAIERTLERALASPAVTPFLSRFHGHPDHSLVAYIVPKEYMMQHLLADLGEHEAHHGEEASGAGGVLGHLGEMYALKPLRQLRDGARSPAVRIIFAEPLTAAGASVPIARALDAGVLRFPLFFAELDEGGVTFVMETPRRHTWGAVPVPAF